MRFLTLPIFLLIYCWLCYLDNRILGEVFHFQNFILSAILAGLYLCIYGLVRISKCRKL